MANNYIDLPEEGGGGGGGGVTTLNSLTGTINLIAGPSITITTIGQNIQISSSALPTALISLNGSTFANQTLIVGTAGTDFNISDNNPAGIHTLNLPTASATNRGALSSADWTTFNSKQAAGNYITALTGDGTATGPGSAVFTLTTVNGNVGTFGTASSVGAFTVNTKGLITAASNTSIQIAESQVTNLVTDLAGKQPVGNYITALTGDVTASGPGSAAATLATVNGNVGSFTNANITVNGKGLITAAANGTNGTVTSVALALPVSVFTVSGSPVTSTGTLTGTFTTQTANTVFAGPTIGSAATPTFRALVAADLPANTTVTKSANYTILSSDSIIFIDSSGGAFNLTLPSPTGLAGKTYRVVDSTGFLATNNVTLIPNGAEKISGLAANRALQTSWDIYTIVCNGIDWFLG